MIHAAPTKVTEKTLEPTLHTAQVQIVTKTAFETGVPLTRLVRINLPRVKKENAGLSLAPVDPPNRRAKDHVGKKAEITATAAWPIEPEDLCRRDRNLENTVPAISKRKSWSFRHAVKIVMDGVDARRVLVASLLELVERPKRIRANGIARRAVALHRLAAQVFQEFLGPNDILTKLGTALKRYADMLISVARQLVAGNRRWRARDVGSARPPSQA